MFNKRSKTEILVVAITLMVIVVFAGFNFRISQIKARDIQRKNDLKHIRAALNDYFKKYEYYPTELSDPTLTDFIHPLPRDPKNGQGSEYLFSSNGKAFQLFASLEQKDEIEYNEKVAKKGLKCGTRICNVGLSSSLDVKLLEDLATV
ncbi:MAG: hypothetical protein Q7S79_04145 [bacterium]|nr:hypothetical protein [bacterium]